MGVFVGLFEFLRDGYPALVAYITAHFDHLTIGVAAAVVLLKAGARYACNREIVTAKLAINDFLDGFLPVPFFVLSQAALFPDIVFMELASHPNEMTIAGTMALFVSIERIIRG